MRVLALGDLLLDIVPQRRPASSADTTQTPVGIGGRAAAVAAWVSALGGEAGLIGARGDDIVARMAAAELYRRGVRMHGPIVPGEAGTVATLLAEYGEAERNASSPITASFTADDLDPSWFVGADALHISSVAGIVAAAARMARHERALVSADLPGAEMIRYAGAETVAERLLRLRPRVLFGTDDALEALGILPSVPVVVVTRNDDSAQIRRRGRLIEIPAPDVAVVDPAGTDDAFVAGFLLGADLDDAIVRARRAATMCRGLTGALPAMREGVVSATSSAP